MRKWYRRSGAIVGGVIAGVLAVGTAFGVVSVMDTSSETGQLSPIASAEPLSSPASSDDPPVLVAPGATASPDVDRDDDIPSAAPSASPDDDDGFAGPSASPDDDDDSGPSDNSGPGGSDDDDDDDGSGRGRGRGRGDDD